MPLWDLLYRSRGRGADIDADEGQEPPSLDGSPTPGESAATAAAALGMLAEEPPRLAAAAAAGAVAVVVVPPGVSCRLLLVKASWLSSKGLVVI